MRPGRLIAVVGPSGVGKDSVMAGIMGRDPSYRLVRRTITRPPELGGEDFEYLTPPAFEQAVDQGAFCLYWGAHDLRYGIPASALEDVKAGHSCLANLSRKALSEAASTFADLTVLNLKAQPETLAKRLKTRGRETQAQIEARLARASAELPTGLNIIEVSNDGALEETVAMALSQLQPVKA